MGGKELNFPKAAGLIAAQGPEIVGVRVQNHSGSPFLLGEVVEAGTTEDLFAHPKDKRTEDYITGRFG